MFLVDQAGAGRHVKFGGRTADRNQSSSRQSARNERGNQQVKKPTLIFLKRIRIKSNIGTFFIYVDFDVFRATAAKCEAQGRSEEIESRELQLSFKENRFIEEKQFLESQIRLLQVCSHMFEFEKN